MFSQLVIEKLDYYVYFLQDPITDEVFYVGKGTGNRIFDHIECAIETNDKTEKLETIRDILESGNKVKHFILRHGLTEQIAFEIEAALIDFVGMKNLANLQTGHYSNDYGIKSTGEISAMYEASELNSSEPIMLININKRYRRDMTDIELYDATRKSWVVGTRREKVSYAIATYRGLTREIYEIKNWYSVKANGKIRWAFNGIMAEPNICRELKYRSIGSFFKKGAANPIKYLNC